MKKILASIIALFPTLSLAQVSNTRITDFNSLTFKLTEIGNVVIQLLIAFAVIYIIFNVVRYIMAADKPEDRNKFGGAVLWGIVGLFVILSIWGLVRILTTTAGTTGLQPPTQSNNEIPSVNRFR